MRISEIERKIAINRLWHCYLRVCENEQHAINAMKKVTGKKRSADFTEEDIKKLCDDLCWREDEALGLNEVMFDYYHGDFGDRN